MLLVRFRLFEIRFLFAEEHQRRKQLRPWVYEWAAKADTDR